jgi:UDP-2,3-diacylglucosamine hydrolase
VSRALFISDLHLTGERPEASEQFFRFLHHEARDAQALYILGDLFEYWIGDDELEDWPGDPLGRQVAKGLRQLSDTGVALRLMHGNRDFLIGERFCAAAGAQLLDDPTVAELDGDPFALLHGDTLCTDDLPYQAWRHIARSAPWQQEFLAKPRDQRRVAVLGYREQSKAAVRAKAPEIMDANVGAVCEAFRRSGVTRMIHGHTHRPAHHQHVVDGKPCERWVLPDWYQRGGYLALEHGAVRPVQFSEV